MKINLSQVKGSGFADASSFVAAVDGHITALRRHQTTVGEASPSAHALIERSVRRVQFPIKDGKPDDFVPDYEIIDDTPPPPSLDERKIAIAIEVQQEAQRQIDVINPPLKRRLANIEFTRAMAIEEAKRSPAQVAAIAAGKTRDSRIDAIHYHMAKLEAEIHDLTEETIGQWKPVSFPA
jgi:hypothetical protein